MDGETTSGYAGRLIRASTPPPPPPPDPVAVATSEAQAKAEQIVARAQAQAEATISRAEGVAARMREEAVATAKAENDRRMAADLLAFNRRMRQEIDDMRPLMARMVIEAVEAIVGTMPAGDLADRLIRRGLRELKEKKGVLLHVARDDYSFMRAKVEEMTRAGDATISIVLPDSGLAKGVCRLEAGGLTIELGLPSQLAVLETTLLRESADFAAHPEPDARAASGY